MTCKERLTEKAGEQYCVKDYTRGVIMDCEALCGEVDGDCDECPLQMAYNKLGVLEDKLENGTLIELPCKVGDTVYIVPSLCNFRLNIVNRQTENNRICKQKVSSIQMWNSNEWCLWTCDGLNLLLQSFYKKTWFLTKEEAEARLKELQNG